MLFNCRFHIVAENNLLNVPALKPFERHPPAAPCSRACLMSLTVCMADAAQPIMVSFQIAKVISIGDQKFPYRYPECLSVVREGNRRGLARLKYTVAFP